MGFDPKNKYAKGGEKEEGRRSIGDVVVEVA
jgi:hypothetical protein